MALLPGLEIVSGKSELGGGGGSWAGGAGKELVVGDQVGGVGFGVEGGGAGGGDGGVGAGPAVVVVEPPHPASNTLVITRKIENRTRCV